jgi:hypothetical protein
MMKLIWEGHVERMGGKRNAYNNLVGKSEGKRMLQRNECKSEVNVKFNPRELWKDTMVWTGRSVSD